MQPSEPCPQTVTRGAITRAFTWVVVDWRHLRDRHVVQRGSVPAWCRVWGCVLRLRCQIRCNHAVLLISIHLYCLLPPAQRGHARAPSSRRMWGVLIGLYFAGAAAATCTTMADADCAGGDIDKINNATMTPGECCALCAAHPECVVAVVATDHTPVQCMLKSAECVSQPSANRIKCCSTDPAQCRPPPPPPPYACPKALLPRFCNVSLGIGDRVAELVGSMTTAEKIAQVGSNGVPTIERLGIPSYQWWGEALHGVCSSPSVTFRPPTPNGTSFPEPIGTASSFDKELFHAAGKVVGKEARVMMNVGNAGGTFWAPNINIVKDPRWGRLQETPGEDPYLSSVYAIAYVTGIQGTDTSYLQASSCCKHFAACQYAVERGMHVPGAASEANPLATHDDLQLMQCFRHALRRLGRELGWGNSVRVRRDRQPARVGRHVLCSVPGLRRRRQRLRTHVLVQRDEWDPNVRRSWAPLHHGSRGLGV
eukprot:m.112865 g.112865  ORF g.112865 m.112865 type:complete len:481 (+) comp21444_c0_seq1:620-2062(+)